MSASDWQPLQPPSSYTQEEVQQILHLAIARRTEQGELSRQELWEIAAELEIDSESLQAAERDWLNGKWLQEKRQEFNRYRRQQLKQKAVRFLIANTFLVSLDLLTTGLLTWSKIVLLIWGLLLSLDAWKTFQTEGEAYEQAFQRWNLKNEMKQSFTTLWNKLKQTWQG